MVLKKVGQFLLIGIVLLSSKGLLAEVTDLREGKTYIKKLYLQHVGYKPNEQGLSHYLPMLRDRNGREQVKELISNSTEAKEYYIQKLYLRYCGSEPNAQDLMRYSALLKEKKDWEKVKRLISNSTESKVLFIRQLYRYYIGYEPEARGLAYYLPKLVTDQDWTRVENLISNSPEAWENRQIKEKTAQNTLENFSNYGDVNLIKYLVKKHLGQEADGKVMGCFLRRLADHQNINALEEDIAGFNLDSDSTANSDHNSYAAAFMACLVDLHQSEKTRSEIDIQTASLDLNYKKTMILSYLNYFYMNIEIIPDKSREKLFYHYLKTLDKIFPEVSIFKYFFDYGTYVANAPDLGGQEVLIDFFNKKRSLRNSGINLNKYNNRLNNVIVSEYKQFTSHLNALEKSDSIGETKFLILYKGSIGGHYVPVFIKRDQSTTKIIITDSGPWTLKDSKTGQYVVNRYVSGLQRAIAQSSLRNVKLFAFSYGRQSDGVSCSMTALRDILESCKVNLFDYLESLRPNQIMPGNHPNTFVIDYYPPNFMKVAQRLSYIDDFEKINPHWKTLTVASKTVAPKPGNEVGAYSAVEEKTLREVIQSHTLQIDTDSGIQKRNFYLRKRAFKYFAIIIRSVIGKHAALEPHPGQ